MVYYLNQFFHFYFFLCFDLGKNNKSLFLLEFWFHAELNLFDTTYVIVFIEFSVLFYLLLSNGKHRPNYSRQNSIV